MKLVYVGGHFEWTKQEFVPDFLDGDDDFQFFCKRNQSADLCLGARPGVAVGGLRIDDRGNKQHGVCAPELGVVEGGAHAGETSVHDRGIARRERILPVVHVHHRVDSNGSSVGSFFDFFSDLLVRGSGGLDDLEANLARHLEAIGVAEFVG